MDSLQDSLLGFTEIYWGCVFCTHIRMCVCVCVCVCVYICIMLFVTGVGSVKVRKAFYSVRSLPIGLNQAGSLR